SWPKVPPLTSCGVSELCSGYQPSRRSSAELVMPSAKADAALNRTISASADSSSAIRRGTQDANESASGHGRRDPVVPTPFLLSPRILPRPQADLYRQPHSARRTCFSPSVSASPAHSNPFCAALADPGSPEAPVRPCAGAACSPRSAEAAAILGEPV